MKFKCNDLNVEKKFKKKKKHSCHIKSIGTLLFTQNLKIKVQWLLDTNLFNIVINRQKR